VLVRDDMPVTDEFSEWGAEYLVSNGYAPIIRDPVIRTFKDKIINIHPAFLPYGRGIFLNFWCILYGYPIGVTIHFIDSGTDTGPIIARKDVETREDDTMESLYARLLSASEESLRDSWDEFVTGKILPVPQESREDKALYHSRVESELLLDLLPLGWKTPLNRIREMVGEISACVEF